MKEKNINGTIMDMDTYNILKSYDWDWNIMGYHGKSLQNTIFPVKGLKYNGILGNNGRSWDILGLQWESIGTFVGIQWDIMELYWEVVIQGF